jgi:hypothetical protein
MRDDLPPRPAFRFSASDEALAVEGPPPRQSEAAGAPALSQTGRVVAIGAVLACLLGAAIGLSSPKSFRGAPDTETAKAKAADSAAEMTFRPIGGRYQPPDRARIMQAYDDAGRLLREEGVSGVARAGMACFDRLARAPEFGLMDYCLALDAYGAQAYQRAAGETAPPSTYFGQAPVRRQRAVQQLTAGQTDANSRLLDTNRLIQLVALQAQPPAAPAPSPAPADVQEAAAEPAEPPHATLTIPLPWGNPRREEPKPPAPVVAERDRPPPPAMRRREPRREYVEPGPPLARGGPAPSFDCRLARTHGERMVCNEPALAAADRRMAAAFERALADAPNPRALVADQNRWLALRDDIAPDYEGVMGLYQDRIAELRRQRY